MPVGSSVRSDREKQLDHPGDLYRLPLTELLLWVGVFEPAPCPPGIGPGLLVAGPCAGDGRICYSLGQNLGAVVVASDLHCAGVYEGDRVVTQRDALEWVRPPFDGRVIVAENLPFGIQDQIVDRIWSQFLPGDELILWMRDMALCCDQRPGQWYRKGIFPFRDQWAFHWRVRHERPDGSRLKSPAESHSFYRAVKGSPATATTVRHFFRRVTG